MGQANTVQTDAYLSKEVPLSSPDMTLYYNSYDPAI